MTMGDRIKPNAVKARNKPIEEAGAAQGFTADQSFDRTPAAVDRSSGRPAPADPGREGA